MTPSITDDVETIGKIDVVPTILEVICRTTGMGFAAVARVTEDRWVACAVRDEIAFGLTPGGELEVATTICHEIRQSGEPVIIDHVAQDEAFCGHPTPARYGFQSYISMPIICRGEFFGTLCAIDPRPARLNTPETVGMFRLFADLIARHLEVHDRLARSEAALLDARQAAELREQFIAVLGHDLRNPLASIQGGTRLLLKTPLDERAQTVVGLMQNSVGRMAGLIDNILDFARARLGGGFEVERRPNAALASAVDQAVAELRMAHPARTIRADVEIDQPVACDGPRITQLASKLIANALAHGSDSAPVEVQARTAGGEFELSVSNQGAPIPPAAMERLFQPFSRAGQQGLGLGLYIASEIAEAHGGTLSVASDATETRFTFRMPLA
jgi:signal transduction histidine kinase